VAKINQENQIAAVLDHYKIPYKRQYQFHPTRKWRFDFAIPQYQVAIEFQGGIFTKGGHTRGFQYAKDCEKMRAAVLLGWRVLYYSTLDMHKNGVWAVPGEVLKMISVVCRERSLQPLPF
jgi:very-short-patch-repair endonuclease